MTRDRTEPPSRGRYSICYVNGFQVQPGEREWWQRNHPDLLLRDADGELVIDQDWNEVLLDPTTAAKRRELAAVVGRWISRCAADGFEAVEIDNLDSYGRSHGLVSRNDAVALIRRYASVAHAKGLAIAQKNAAELVRRRDKMGTDFAVAEECNRWSECDAYVRGYGRHVLVIEYRRQDFERGCRRYPGLSIVLRDLDLVPRGQAGYLFDAC